MTIEVIVTGVLALVGFILLIGLGVWLRRRTGRAGRTEQELHDDPQLRQDLLDRDAERSQHGVRRLM